LILDSEVEFLEMCYKLKRDIRLIWDSHLDLQYQTRMGGALEKCEEKQKKKEEKKGKK